VRGGFLAKWDLAKRTRLMQATNALVAIARDAGAPIVWVRQEFQPDLSDAFLEMRKKGISITIQGTPGCQVVRELDKRADDREVMKKRYSAFRATNLDELLHQ